MSFGVGMGKGGPNQGMLGAPTGFNGNFLSVLPGALQIMVSDQGVTNGATMIRADQSGNGEDYSTTANQPLTSDSLNGRPVLTFSSSSVLDSALSVSQAVTPWEYALVVNVTSWTTNARILGNSVADSCVVWAQTSTPGQLGMYAGTAGPIATSLAVGSWGLVRGAFTDSTADFIQSGSGSASSGVNAGANASSNIRIGGLLAPTLPMQVALVAIGPVGFSSGAPFLDALDSYYGGLVLHP